jgi:hypothetical protein
MTAFDVVAALTLVVVGAWLTRSVYRLGLTAGVRLGYGMGHNDATAAARRLVAERVEQLGSEAK